MTYRLCRPRVFQSAPHFVLHRRMRPVSAPLRGLGAAALVVGLLAATPATAQPRPVGIEETVVASAKIIDIDAANQTVLVQGPRGNVFEVASGEEVKNFGQIRKGDILTIVHSAAVVAGLEPLDSKDVAMSETVERTARAGEGAKPGVVREITTTATAQVTKVDAAKRTITFRGPRETLRTIQVRDPAIDLSKVKQGQMAKIVFRETVAITVKAPPKAQ
jgi:YbbR domain-containing protein